MEESIDEGAIGIACCGVDDHAVCFIKHDEVVILVQDVERDILRDELESDGLGNDDGDEVAGIQRLLGLGRAVVDKDVPFLDKRL